MGKRKPNKKNLKNIVKIKKCEKTVKNIEKKKNTYGKEKPLKKYWKKQRKIFKKNLFKKH